MGKYSAKVEISQGEVKEVMLGLTRTATEKAEKLSVSREAILNMLKMASAEISAIKEDGNFIVLREIDDAVDFGNVFPLANGTTLRLVDETVQKAEKIDLEDALRPFIRGGNLEVVRQVLENKLGVKFSSQMWGSVKKELLNPQVNLADYLKQLTVPAKNVAIVGCVSKKGEVSVYADIITVIIGENLRIAESEDTVVIRLASIA